MSTVMASLPPTVNALDHEQRLRLMKSTRKLEALLGTTPRLLEEPQIGTIYSRPGTPYSRSESPTHSFLRTPSPSNANLSLSRSSSRASHRSARIYSSSNSSISSLSFDSFDDFNDSRESFDSESPGPSPTFISETTAKPSFSVAAELPRTPRAKKYAEPALYLRLHGAGQRPSNDSYLDLTDDGDEEDLATATPGKTFKSPLSPLSPTTIENRLDDNQLEFKRKKMAKLARTLGENIPPELVFPSQLSKKITSSGATPPRIRSNSIDERRLSANLFSQPKTLTHATSMSFDDTDVSAKGRLPSQMFSNVHVEVPNDIARYCAESERKSSSRSPSPEGGLGGMKSYGKVKGREWSGQWNQEMDDVMSKLRKL